MQDILPRAAAARIAQMASALPVVAITGARQTGKSSLVRSDPALIGYASFDLDDLQTRADALDDPHAFVRRAPRLIIDEVQRAPELLLAIKAEVDAEQQRTKGRFIITGCANLLVMRDVSDSLAGRAGYVIIEPMTRRELLGGGGTGGWSRCFEIATEEWGAALDEANSPASDWGEATRRGGFPVPALQLDGPARNEWFSAYIATYLERDLRQISAIEDLGDFRRAMRSFAIRAGTPLNVADVARDLGLAARTLRRWVELLHVTHQIVRLPGYSRRDSGRLRKRAKYYWNDPALALHVSGERAPTGIHLETLVFNDLRTWSGLDPRSPTLHYWRDDADREVDFVIERDDRLLAIEVKATTRPGSGDWRNLRHFVKEHDNCVGGLLLHAGPETFPAAERILATPWWRVL